MPGIKDAKCVLVIGATAGLGRALALAIHDLDTQPTVVVVGRRQERLDELAKRSNRIKTFKADINTTEENLRTFVRDVLSQYPQVIWSNVHTRIPTDIEPTSQLDAVVFMSGVQHIYDFTKPESVDLSRKSVREFTSATGTACLLSSSLGPRDQHQLHLNH